MVLLITYDLNKEPKDYDKLFRAISELGLTRRDPDLDSVWFVSTSYNLKTCYDHLKKAIDNNDRLMITKLNRGEYEYWLSADVAYWISSQLS